MSTVVLKKEDKPEKSIDLTEHLLSIDELKEKCGTSFEITKPTNSDGLTVEEAKQRLIRNGPNALTPPKKRPAILQFLDALLGLFNLMLLISGIACYILYGIDPVGNASNVYIGGILLGVAFINAYIEFYQVRKSQAILESFLNLIPAKCYVIRDKATIQISAADLVYGDVVYIRSGDKVPADVILFSVTDLKVDNSSLTGESEPQERLVKNTQQNPLEATNIAFNGTLAVNGEGYGIVVRTGDNTVIGQIASLTANEERRDSPMSQEITHFVHIIASVAAIVALIFFIVAITAKGQSIGGGINFAIGTFISFVPEGLPATVTILLTIAAKKMADRKVLVKDLQGVETLGAITLLATDKTGTLTRNQMTVTYVWTGLKLFFATSQSASETQVAAPLDNSHEGVDEILHMSVLCSRARFEKDEGPINERPVLGDATEAGLLRNAALKLPEFDKALEKYPKVFEIPFNSTNKWAMTIHRKKHSNGHFMIYLKGAPERVLKLCSTFFDGKQAIPLTEEHTAAFDKTYKFMASKGHRVLAFSALALPGDKFPEDFVFSKDPLNFPQENLTFYGLVSLEDPPKHGVREAIGHCREAGIKVMMVTGDHPLTAEAIGRKINLMLQDTKEIIAQKRGVDISQVPESEVRAIVIHGEKIDSLTEADWENIFSKDEIIFARTSPKHKLQIVKHAQSLGHIVGVTGDGVNDSPALKKADLGIAMNESGSDVSKEAAAMILVDDNFASTVNGIEEGRLIFQNLKKSIQYTVTHTMPEVYANLLFIAVPLPLPLAAIQIVMTDLGFEMFLALSYAFDTPESKTGLMKLPPRKPVTEESKLKLKEKAQMKGNLTFSQKISQQFTSLFEKKDEETLVDADLLSYSYLEAGTIETLGCLTCYFFAMWYHYGITPTDMVNFGASFGAAGNPTAVAANGRTFTAEEQVAVLAMGQGAYFVALFIQQCFNVFMCKARMGLPFGKFMFENKYSFFGVAGGTVLVGILSYIPALNIAFNTNWQLTPFTWLIAMGFGLLLMGYNVARTLIKRARNPLQYTKEIDGLDLHPTRWSTGGRR
ncbi:hypothetical protein EDD86DRAFT_241269 [Gorgonomyces haynaldii]|nr:hypothetical protein EDD86DRAFT_241269 [Gorgonomyces haynaldii]